MNTKFKRFLKIMCIVILLMAIILLSIFAYYYIKINIKYGDVDFDKDKLIFANSYAQILDDENNIMSNASLNGRTTISCDKLPKHTIDAFIAIEDKDFFRHNGINYKRMLKSIIVNLKSGYAKEGASTISQQLIKNTHLSNEKTIERKLKEIFLTQKLEKSFSKEEILETYLNVIYFGNGCFGIENASEFYFNKDASDLTISESATLAGLIKSPKLYSPTQNYENCIKRRNLVISQMLKYGMISDADAEKAKSGELKIYQHTIDNTIERTALNSATKVLNLNEKDLINSNIKIKTYINSELQTYIDSLDLNLFEYDGVMPEYAIIIEDNKTGGIVALRTSSSVVIDEMQRQPASCLKPFLVYAPNLEDGKVNLMTKINDEKTSIKGFTPHNAGDKYAGEISVKEAISSSSNICATKLLDYYGISKSKKTAEKFGFHFEKEDNHLALALGSMYRGCDLLTLTNAYATLANNGIKKNVSFIQNIDGINDISIYNNENDGERVVSPETAYLLTTSLQQCANSGTAKKLKNYSNYVAAKTGTNGASKSNFNTDAYCLSYSKDFTVCVWIGVKNNDCPLLPSSYNGGNQPAMVSRLIWDYLKPNKPFSKPSSIVDLKIDKIAYERNGSVELASENTFDRYIITEYFNQKYSPKKVADTFTKINKPKLFARVESNNVVLYFDADEFTTYKVYKKAKNGDILLSDKYKLNSKFEFIDENLKSGFYEYYLVAYKNNISEKSDTIKIFVP